MSGPNPPEPGSGEEDPGVGQSAPELTPEVEVGDGVPAIDEAAAVDPGPVPDNTAYSQAYSAPESEQFRSGPYVPVDPRLYDYDSYDAHDDSDAHAKTPRWPWVVGVTVIVAAISLVVSVALLFARTETHDMGAPVTTTSSDLMPPVQDEITRTSTTTTQPPPPPSTTTEEPPPVETSTTTEEPPPVETPAPEPSTTTSEPATSTTQAKPLQVTYSVTGTKAPFDQITITYLDPSGQRHVLRNQYIPWSVTVTPISLSEVGSVEVTSMLRLSKLNCSITRSDGTVLSSNNNDSPAASCG